MSYASLGNSTIFAMFLKRPIITTMAAVSVIAAVNNVEPAVELIKSIKNPPPAQTAPIKPITKATV